MANRRAVAKPTFRELRTACLFVGPLVGFIAIFILLPVAGTLVNSLFEDVSFIGGKRFCFLDNYKSLLGDAGFVKALRFTLLFIVVSVPLELGLGLAFALLLNEEIPLRGLLRGCVLIPWAIPAAISGRTWELIYNYSYGLANWVFLALGLTSEPVNWLGTSAGAFFAVVLADAWKTTPFVAIILLAGLQAIPRDLMEQARTDRANGWQVFYKITLPMLRPVLIVALLFRTIDGLRVFDLIYVLTNGGPGGATSSVSHYAYTYFFSGDYGYGSAISVVLFVIAVVLAVGYIKAGRFSTEAA